MNNNIDIENDKNQCHNILGITVKTPKNVIISPELMNKVIQSLQGQTNAILEHVKGNGRLFSLICSSLAWLKHLEINSMNIINSKRIRIVYASNSRSALQYLEQQLKQTDYTPKISYFNQDFNIQNQNQDDLILIEYDNLFHADLSIFENSIMILDDFDYVQDRGVLGKFTKKNIEEASNELNELVNELKMQNEIDQKQQLCEIDLRQIEFVKESIYHFGQILQQTPIREIQQQNSIYEFIQHYHQFDDDNEDRFYKYSKICENISKLSHLKYFDPWFKFIKLAIFCYKEIQKQNDNFSIKIYETTKKSINVTILVKYNLQYILDQFKKVKFNSIIISSNNLFSSSYEDLSNYNFNITQKINKSQYFQTFLIYQPWNQFLDNDPIYNILFNNFESIINSIPNGVLLIFSSFKKVKSFKTYCEFQQPNFFDEIGKNKKLFWGLKKNQINDYIKCSEKGAILFESYERIINRDLDFPGHLCKGLIFVEFKTINSHKCEQDQYRNNQLYYLNRWFNRIVGRSLLYENDKGVLLTFSGYRRDFFWGEILRDFDKNQSLTISEIEQKIREYFQNDQQSQNDVRLTESYYEQKAMKHSKKLNENVRRQRRRNLQKNQILEKSLKIKKQKNTNKQKKNKKQQQQQQQQQQRYFENQECEKIIESDEHKQQQEIQNQEEKTKRKSKNKDEKVNKNKKQTQNKQNSTSRKIKKQEQQSNVNQRNLFEFFQIKNPSQKKSTQKDNENDPQI